MWKNQSIELQLPQTRSELWPGLAIWKISRITQGRWSI